LIDLYQGDCLEIMSDIPDNSVDMILADLPYEITAASFDVLIPFEPLWNQYNRIAKENAAMVFTASQPFTTALISSNIQNFRYEWIWEKPQGTNPMVAKYQPLKSHENIVVFYRKRPTYNPQMDISTPYGGFKSNQKKLGEVYGDLKSQHRDNPEGTRYPKTVLKFKQEKGLHPTQKPLTLMEYLIKTYTNENDVVLDNCFGSGTTGVAAKKTGRGFIGIELDKDYFKIGSERINKTPVPNALDALFG
jgi:site-specific DNA-methyltransferase (adenine-specific)